MVKWLQELLLKEEDFDSHISILAVNWDRLPNPITEARRAMKVPVLAHRATAHGLLGRLLLRFLYRSASSPTSLTQGGKVLEVYPLLRRVVGGSSD